MAGKNAKSQSKSSDADASPEKTGVPPTRSTGPETATGQQIKWAAGEVEVPKGDERGSQVPILDEPDKDGKPVGLQAEPALFVSNGQISHTDVPTPTGLQPVSTVAGSPEEAKKLVDQRVEEHKAYIERTPKLEKLDEPTVGRLGKTELRAIGLQRGYTMPETGTRAMRASFIAAQDKDDRIGGSVGSKNGSSKGSQQARGAKSTKASMQRATKRTAPKGAGKKGGKK